MASVQLEDLTSAQQSVLEQYVAITDQETELAIPILERAQWNLQVIFPEIGNE